MAVTVVGFILAIAVCFLPAIFGPSFGTWQILLATVVINVGTTLMLAAALVVIERLLVTRVQDVATRSASAIVDERAREFTATTDRLISQVNAIQKALDDRAAEKESARAVALRQLAEEPTFDTVADALEAANDVGALAIGSLAVPAAEDIVDAPRITVRWGPVHLASNGGWNEPNPEQPQLSVAVNYQGPDQREQRFSHEVEWRPDMSALDVLAKLSDALEEQRLTFVSRMISTNVLFRNLSLGLKEATEVSTSMPDDAWFSGQVFEWLSSGWVITEQGLFSKEHGILYRAGQVKFQIGRSNRNDALPEDDYSAPEGVDQAFLKRAVNITRLHILGSRQRRQMGPMGVVLPAYTTNTSPR